MSGNGDKAILSFDGTSFESFDSPQNFSIFQEDFLFADAINKIFIWYYEGGNHNNGSQLYSFDGSNLSHIPNPSNDMISGRFGVPFGDHILLPYMTHVDGIDYIYSLYKYEGSNLVEIPGFPATVFHEIQLYSKEDKVYIALDNYADSTSVLYEYDGNSLSEISISSFYSPNFLTEFDGKDIFSLFDTSTNKSILHSYEGGSFDEITVPEYASYYNFGGILNNNLYLGSYNTTAYGTTDLYSLTPGDTEMHSVSSLPSGTIYRNFQLKPNNDFLIYVLEENEENTLYAQDTNEQFQKLDPDNHILDSFEFQLGDKVYYSYWDSDWTSKMWVWDGVLSTPDFNQSQSNIILHPNPTTNNVFAELPNELTSQDLEISLISIDGKVISK